MCMHIGLHEGTEHRDETEAHRGANYRQQSKEKTIYRFCLFACFCGWEEQAEGQITLTPVRQEVWSLRGYEDESLTNKINAYKRDLGEPFSLCSAVWGHIEVSLCILEGAHTFWTLLTPSFQIPTHTAMSSRFLYQTPTEWNLVPEGY